MTTIGYGEIYPITHFGRFSAIIACFLGVFLFSLFVVAVTNTVSLTKFDEEPFNDLLAEKRREGEVGQ
jgi:hypothetical protein